MCLLTDLPPELLSDIVQVLVRDYLFDYFAAHNAPWDAIASLSAVSATLRSITHKLLASGLAIPSLQLGQALRLARRDADARFEAACLREDHDQDQDQDAHSPAVTNTQTTDEIRVGDQWWRESALLELYSVVREARCRSERITREGHHLRRLADLPQMLVEPMERARAARDGRLVRPALVEGAYLIACTSFVGQLSASARFFELVHAILSEEPEWVCAWSDNIEKTLLSVAVLEKNCTVPLRWIQIPHPRFVEASHIYASRIVPALSNFLNTPAPLRARWRITAGALLEEWTPLDDEVHQEVMKADGYGGARRLGLGLEVPEDVGS